MFSPPSKPKAPVIFKVKTANTLEFHILFFVFHRICPDDFTLRYFFFIDTKILIVIIPRNNTITDPITIPPVAFLFIILFFCKLLHQIRLKIRKICPDSTITVPFDKIGLFRNR